MDEGGGAPAAEHRFEREADVRAGDSEIGRARLVDAHAQLRLRIAVIAVQTDQPRIRAAFGENEIAPRRQLLKGGTADDDFDRLVQSAQDRLTHDDGNFGLRHAGGPFPNLIHDGEAVATLPKRL